MTNHNVQTIPIMLDRQRHLRIDFNLFAELEVIYGDHNKAVEALKSGSFKAIRTFIWLALAHEDNDLTEKEVGALLVPSKVNEVAQVIQKAVETL